MTGNVLLDAGFVVALLSRRDSRPLGRGADAAPGPALGDVRSRFVRGLPSSRNA